MTMLPASKEHKRTSPLYHLPNAPPRLLPMALIGFARKAQRGARAAAGNRDAKIPQYVYKGASSWANALIQMVKEVQHLSEEPLDANPTAVARREHEGLQRVSWGYIRKGRIYYC